MKDFAPTQREGLHDSAFMPTPCFFKDSLCISSLLNQTEAETENRKEEDVRAGSELGLLYQKAVKNWRMYPSLDA